MRTIWTYAGGFGILLSLILSAFLLGVGAGTALGPPGDIQLSDPGRNDWTEIGFKYLLVAVSVAVIIAIRRAQNRKSRLVLAVPALFLLYSWFQLISIASRDLSSWPAGWSVSPLIIYGVPIVKSTMILILGALTIEQMSSLFARTFRKI